MRYRNASIEMLRVVEVFDRLLVAQDRLIMPPDGDPACAPRTARKTIRPQASALFDSLALHACHRFVSAFVSRLAGLCFPVRFRACGNCFVIVFRGTARA